MQKKNLIILSSIVAVAIIFALVAYFTSIHELADEKFAKCLNEKGVTFYGSYKCPHCNLQKKYFGNSVLYLNYVECLDNDQGKICKENAIKVYPTWTFQNGSRLTGRQSLETLSEMSGCELTVI